MSIFLPDPEGVTQEIAKHLQLANNRSETAKRFRGLDANESPLLRNLAEQAQRLVYARQQHDRLKVQELAARENGELDTAKKLYKTAQKWIKMYAAQAGHIHKQYGMRGLAILAEVGAVPENQPTPKLRLQALVRRLKRRGHLPANTPLDAGNRAINELRRDREALWLIDQVALRVSHMANIGHHTPDRSAVRPTSALALMGDDAWLLGDVICQAGLFEPSPLFDRG